MKILHKFNETLKAFISRYCNKKYSLYDKLYVSQFYSAIESYIIPHMYNQLKVTAREKSVETRVIALFSPQAKSLEESLKNILNRVVLWDLIFNGKSYLKIVRETDAVSLIPLHNAFLNGIYPFLYYKDISSSEVNINETPYAWLYYKDIICIKLPRELRIEISSLIKALAYYSDNFPLPEFVREELENSIPLDPTIPYELLRICHLQYLFKANKNIGWNSSSFLGDNALEYYKILLFFRFHKFIVQLRSDIYNQINIAIKKCLNDFKSENFIFIDHPVTAEVIDDAIFKLTSGNTSFDDLLKPFANT